jgi:beta-lactamase regulating signal transducer with metallopeptidase domain
LDFPADADALDSAGAAASKKNKDSDDLVERRNTVAERSSAGVMTDSNGNSDNGFGVVSSETGQRSSTAGGLLTSHPKAAEPSGHSSVVATGNLKLKSGVAETAFVVWAAGGFVVVLLSTFRLWKFRRMVRREVVSPAELCKAQWEKEWSAVCSESSIKRGPHLCFTESIGPGICPGLTRPSLVIPVSLWQKFDDSQRLAVLRHEAAHLTRRDLWRSLLVRLLALPHWFNPCVWLAVRRFDEAAEWACDERSVQSNSDEGCQFAELLVELAASGSRHRVVVGQSLVTENALKDRVARLVRSENRSERAFWRTAVVLMIPCLLLTSAMFDIRLVAQSNGSPETALNQRDESPSPIEQSAIDHAGTAKVAALNETADVDPQVESKSRGDDAAPGEAAEATAEVVADTAKDSKTAKVEFTPDPIPSLAGFKFSPWYELDDDRLWQQIGWKIDLKHLPDDIDAFVDLMQSPQFKNSALDFGNNVVATLGVKRLKDFPNIESLRLSGSITVSPKQMELIAQLPRLRKLDLSGSQVGDDHIEALLPLSPTLEYLNLERTQITGAALRQIADLTNLQELNFRWTALGKWDYLRRPHAKTGIIMKASTGLMRRLQPLQKLRTLRVYTEDVGAFDGIQALPQLQTLELVAGGLRPLTASDFESIAQLPKLRSLRLSSPPDVEHISLLRPLTCLRELSFPGDDKISSELSSQLQRHLPRTRFGLRFASWHDEKVSFNFSDVPLNDALEFFSKSVAGDSDLPIYIDEAALEENGIAVDEPIEMDGAGVTLKRALRMTLSDFGLIAIPHDRGFTVTAMEGNRLYRRDYDLSELFRGVDGGDNLTVRLARILQKLITPERWGRDFPVLPRSDKATDEVATTEIVEAGTTLIVMADAQTHYAVGNFVNQLTRGEDSQLLDVEFRQMFERRYSEPARRNDDGKVRPKFHGKGRVNFAELPLCDGCEYLSRVFDVPLIIDSIGTARVGVAIDHPISRVYEYDTLEDALDQLLEPLKLTWFYEDEVIRVTAQEVASQRPTIVVHQLFDDLVRPHTPGFPEDWHQMLKSICNQGTGLADPRYEIWFGRLIVNEPWRNQLKLARLLRKFNPAKRQVICGLSTRSKRP